MSLVFLIKLYERYKSAKLNKSIEKIKKETYGMLLEIDNKLEDLQNKEYTSTKDWENNWKQLYEIRDNVFVTIGNIRTPNVSSNLSKRIDEYKIIQNSSTKLSEMVSYAGEKVNSLEDKLTEEKLTKLVDYTRQVSDFSGIGDETSVLNEKITRNNARSYLTEVLGKLEDTAPDYAPNGNLMNSNKWKLKNELKKLKISAKVRGDIGKKCRIECNYIKKLPSNAELEKYATKLNPKKEAMVLCYVADEIDAHTRQVLENFEHSAMSVFCYELKTNSLVYNKKAEPNSYFLGYFDPKQKPKKFKEFIRGNSKDGLISVDKLNVLRLKRNDPCLRFIGNISRVSSEKYKIMEG